jgi:hypothetical protein
MISSAMDAVAIEKRPRLIKVGSSFRAFMWTPDWVAAWSGGADLPPDQMRHA